MAFDIDRFMALSRAVEIADLDWAYIAEKSLTPAEARALRYMADVESHTILYMRDLLAGHSAHDPEVVSFLSCWVYEETHHGRALDKFLAAAGYPAEPTRYTDVARKASVMETIEAIGSRNAARMTQHFAATHMVWGAINEMTAAVAYTQLARYTDNTELKKLLLRLAKDERRHQSFYYHQAEKRLGASRIAQGIATVALRYFWGPVGVGVGDPSSFGFIAALLFDDPESRAELRSLNETIARLPGLAWFDVVEKRISGHIDAFKRAYPDEAASLPKRTIERPATSPRRTAAISA